ncbi:hypothetical protein V8E55_011393 [Tylopilus felleus]
MELDPTQKAAKSLLKFGTDYVKSHEVRNRYTRTTDHKAQRVRQQWEAAKPHSQLIVNAKRVWSLARQRISPRRNARSTSKSCWLSRPEKSRTFALKHDASRITQTNVRYGGQRGIKWIGSQKSSRVTTRRCLRASTPHF